MNASFEEKSAWIQLLSLLVTLAGYFAAAGPIIRSGERELIAFAPLFTVAVIVLVVILIVGYAAVSVRGVSPGRDERDQWIAWKAGSISASILGCGLVIALTGMTHAVENVLIGHFLLLVLFLSEVMKRILQILYYRRGF